MQVRDIIKKVKQIELRTRRKTDASLMGQYHSSFKGQGMTFSEIRPYQFGDEIRRIDWNKTARFREPFVKVMEEERELTVMLMIDVSASMNFGTEISLKKEYVAEIAASIGFSAVGNQDKVGLLLFADRVVRYIPPQKGRKHLLSVISAILSTDYPPAPADFGMGLDYVLNAFPRKSLFFLFSDFQDEIPVDRLKLAARKHQLLAINVRDAREENLPNIGYVPFQDLETGEMRWVNTGSGSFRRRYEFENTQREKRLEETFRMASAQMIKAPTGADYSKLLYQYFQKNR